MNILDRILSIKKKEIKKNKIFFPIKKLENSKFFERKIISLKNKIEKNDIGIISEFKLKSPSKGKINNFVSIVKVTKGYENSGVCGISILTDYHFFNGKKEYIKKIRPLISIPLLRKDFIIDEYQIIESKSIGSDVILLIAKILCKEKIDNLSKLAKSIGLETILEIHDENDINKIVENIDIIGINNRNLKTFIVDNDICIKLYPKVPKNYIKIAESGINNVDYILKLKNIGFQGFLIGEYFMKENNPEKYCKNFILSIKEKYSQK
ncbi:indole-3-glycerol phosphate synthase TrpC [Blattabacterium cuenoti]|uniref:indole-3-glycerol phosphate synthase TrpC n=1 Tax=Blattabacterium cuenoti TaxID=1653831 RepID=UPI00163C9311|nr:indole-3-glycerol phosphate synthase TrpC [Blattabacterium cuenoti]